MKTLALIAVGLFAGAAFAQAPAAARAKTPPTTTTTTTLPAQPERVKVATEQAALIESPEMLRNCREAAVTEQAARVAWKKRGEIADRYDLDMATGPREKMTPLEIEERETGNKLLAELEQRHPWMKAALGGVPTFLGEMAAKTAAVCADATTAKLTEGTVLTVLKRDGELLHVRVETGRATGKNGYIIAGGVKPE